MDLIYRKNNSKEILQRLRNIHVQGDSESINEQENNINIIHEELDTLIQGLKNDNHLNDVKIHYIILLLPLLVASLWLAVAKQWLLTPLYLTLALTIYVWIVHRIMRATIEQYKSDLYASRESKDADHYIHSKLKYLEWGMTIKRKRMILMVIFYWMFFPLLLLLLQELLLEGSAFQSLIWNVILAYTISTALWYGYFHRTFADFDHLEETIALLRGQLIP